jgi:hypothetical protein
VKPGGRPGHEGLSPIDGSPVPGQTGTVEAVLTEGFSTGRFEFRAKTGEVLQALDLTQGSGAAVDEFFGDVTPPNTQFLVYVTGQDVNGAAYQRVLPGTIKPQTVVISPPLVSDLLQGLHQAQTTTYNFQVKNFGPADSFQVSASDSAGFISGISPTTFQLGTNESINVTLQVQPPGKTPTSTPTDLTISVASQTNAGASKSSCAVPLGKTVDDPIVPDLAIAAGAANGAINTDAGGNTTCSVGAGFTVTNVGRAISARSTLTATLLPSGGFLDSKDVKGLVPREGVGVQVGNTLRFLARFG